MAGIMLGPILLLAAMASPQSQARAQSFQPIGGATVRGTASVRIVSGVRFGHGRSAEAPGAVRRPAWLTDGNGQPRAAELLEFQ